VLVAARRFMIVVKRRRAREAAEAAAAKQRATDAAVQGAASRFKGMIANRLRGQLANSKIRRYNGGKPGVFLDSVCVSTRTEGIAWGCIVRADTQNGLKIDRH